MVGSDPGPKLGQRNGVVLTPSLRSGVGVIYFFCVCVFVGCMCCCGLLRFFFGFVNSNQGLLLRQEPSGCLAEMDVFLFDAAPNMKSTVRG